jgi:phosphoglycerate dehydrogenase-like enzyme
MLLWKNTKTLDGLIDDISQTQSKEKAEIALMGSKSINLNEFPKLRGIFRVGVSSTNVPVAEAKKRNISVAFPSEKTKNYIFEETANFTCGLIFKSHYKNLGSLDPWVKNNRAALSEKKLLIIGEGRIGGMVKEKMHAFMEVLSFDPYKYPERKLESLLPLADFVSIHIADTEDNIGFIDSKKMIIMKDNATIINTARGRIVDEGALCEKFKNERLYAAFDVYWDEPYQGKLKEFYPNRFSMTPHVASTCNEYLTGSEKDLRNFMKSLGNKG